MLENSGDDMDEAVAQVEELSRQSQEADHACQKFISDLQLVVKDSERKEFYSSRESATAVLKKASLYPGTPIATEQALELFLDLSGIPDGPQAARFRFTLAGLAHCHSIEFYGFMRRLIHPGTQRLLQKDEIGLVRAAVLRYLYRESFGGPRFFFQVEKLAELLEASGKNRLVTLSPSVRSALDSLIWRISKAKIEGLGGSKEWEERGSEISRDRMEWQSQVRALRVFLWQLDHSEDLRADLQGILEAISSENQVIPGEFERGSLILMRY